MKYRNWTCFVSLLAVAPLILAGCEKAQTPAGKSPAASPASQTAEVPEHGEWWCGGHGVPEEVCARCDKSLVDKFKEKGDWCKEHDRPESQCFLCDASRFDKFAARYEAKYGKKPPMPKN